MTKPANKSLQDRGITLRECDLSSPQDALVAALKDIQILISSIFPLDILAQIPLATAAKTAGVQRFLPCAWASVIPPGGVHDLIDAKEQVYNHIKQLYLPYTIVDVGWWYQLCIPKLPSGKTDYVQLTDSNNIVGDGNVPSALTDLRDIGRYVARIIVDDRTLNKYVFVYNELWTQNQIFDLVEKLSREKVDRIYVSEAELREKVENAPSGMNFQSLAQKVHAQYQMSWGVRGDNQPEYAKYLGYVTGKELYPDFKCRFFEDYASEVLDGGAKGVYQGRYEDLKKHFTHQ